MPIDWVHGLLGGVLIGLAATLLLVFNGRVVGLSGIIFGATRLTDPDSRWRLSLLGGLLLGGALSAWLLDDPFANTLETPSGVLVAAGFLVGFGTRLGSGCTSGHGVCGLSRLSGRSLVATLSFMAAGFLTVFIVKHLLGGV